MEPLLSRSIEHIELNSDITTISNKKRNMSGPDMDEQLMTFVNILGVVTFSSIVLYHFITATPKDAEL